VRERFDFALSRKIKPRRTLRQPMENRKKAETRVNVSTWWERTAAPILETRRISYDEESKIASELTASE
jgi:hypothetical protein